MPPKSNKTSSKAASSSTRPKKAKVPRARSPPPPPLPWEFSTPYQFQRYKVLSKRVIIPSRFFDTYTIQRLGLAQEVATFLGNIGWTQFANIQLRTYTEITYEILSTLQAEYNHYDDNDQGKIRFRCLGQDRELTLAELNFFFGFPNEGITWTTPSFVPNRAWYDLTGQGEYNPRYSKASFLRSYALRYIHRVMTMSIFGRGESTGVVGKTELLFLWAMFKGIQVNTGAWFLRHLLHVSRSSTGKICIGGLLSIMANFYGFVADDNLFHVVEGSHVVDIEMLLNMRVCRHIGGGEFRLLDSAGHVLEHDNPEDDAADEAPPEEDQAPDEPEGDMDAFPAAFPDHHQDAGPSSTYHDAQMAQVIDRMERLETRMTRSEDIQMQILQMLTRMEEKLPRRE